MCAKQGEPKPETRKKIKIRAYMTNPTPSHDPKASLYRKFGSENVQIQVQSKAKCEFIKNSKSQPPTPRSHPLPTGPKNKTKRGEKKSKKQNKDLKKTGNAKLCALEIYTGTLLGQHECTAQPRFPFQGLQVGENLCRNVHPRHGVLHMRDHNPQRI